MHRAMTSQILGGGGDSGPADGPSSKGMRVNMLSTTKYVHDAATEFRGLSISQETFDEAVKENIEDLEMDPEEALAEASEQFQKQGADLSTIVKRVPNDDIGANHLCTAILS